MESIKNNVKNIIDDIPKINRFGEQVIVVAAVKKQPIEYINDAIDAGIEHIGDNHVQEFRQKYDGILYNPHRHFIGRLQTNKVKYLIGKVWLYHSVDRLDLAREISKRSQLSDVTSSILLEVNIGGEESKGGFASDELFSAYKEICTLPNIKVVGLMAMLPFTDDEVLLRKLATSMRQLFDSLKDTDDNVKYLSMGMSGDYKLCIECGSNMVRLGTMLFGSRNY